MIVAFDIDETISRHPSFFSVLAHALLHAEHQVLIITLRADQDGAAADLAEWEVPYTELIVADDEELEAHGFNHWKAHVCRERGVEVFFEDSPEILRQVDSSVTCFLAVDPEIHDLDLLCYA